MQLKSPKSMSLNFSEKIPQFEPLNFGSSDQQIYLCLNLKTRAQTVSRFHIFWNQSFNSAPPSFLPGCKSSSSGSSVWCQQCWLIKAVGRLCNSQLFLTHVLFTAKYLQLIFHGTKTQWDLSIAVPIPWEKREERATQSTTRCSKRSDWYFGGFNNSSPELQKKHELWSVFRKQQWTTIEPNICLLLPFTLT